jgi:membrane protein DedA with SNARE-associated domain/UDP-2,3-diacylglucosamine pyrophosphatase LpxH
MADVNLTELLLNAMMAYGPGVLGSALLLGGVGVPIPGTLLVLAAGALARQGVINWSLALAVGLLGVVLGDNISYVMGRFAKAWLPRRGRGPASATWQKAQARFKQSGALAIYSTRFLLTPLAIPTNLVAGGSGYNFSRFLTFDVAGEVTWLLLYGGLGYIFASQWQLISQFADDFSGWLLGAAMLGVAIYFLMRHKASAEEGKRVIMMSVNNAMKAATWTWTVPQTLLRHWLTWGQGRLDHVLETAADIPFDDTSKIVLFSDVHRGDKSKFDEFAPNEGLFTHALRHYYEDGFTYIELGDGDGLWQTGHLSAIQHAYPGVFKLLHQFKRQNRLHMIVGNHEIQGREYRRVQKDDLVAEEALILRHSLTGQRLFVVHGHQLDVWCDQLSSVVRPAVRLIYAALKVLGFEANAISAESAQPDGAMIQKMKQWYTNQQQKLTQHWAEWARNKHQFVITGHTHLPRFATDRREPYFNTGCCVNPGYLTGIEIQNGSIRLVKWFMNEAHRYKRSHLGPACQLSLYG